ncbi:transcription factor-like 5 protein [Dendropsophus ebraccatus]|uniref:transcription factor-like 5 protein n=1 Tax=Dendropsophus ebraccatus TaxID=150705 RepID=UPI00383108D3
MFRPSPAPDTCPAGSSRSSACVGEGVVNEQVTTNVTVIELADIEYTQLHQLFCAYIDPQGNEGGAETRMGAIVPASAPQYQSTSLTTEGHNLCQVKCQSDASIVHANQTVGHADFQSIFPSTSCKWDGFQPCFTSGDSSREVPMQLRPTSDIAGLNKENENLGHMCEPRTKSKVCVCLEDRFTSLLTDVPRCTEVAEADVTNSLMTNIHHPSQLIGAQPLGKCTPIVKNNTAQSPLQFVYSVINLQNTSADGNADRSLAQTSFSMNCGASCPLLEAAKNKEISLSRGISFCSQHIESVKENFGLENKLLPEEILVKVKDTLCSQSMRKRSHVHHASADMEGRVLGDISNNHKGEPMQSNAVERGAGNKETVLSQRREKHNRMERERRRRIRICCDELKSLVPLCSVETDKATTLKWTVTYLRYIQKTHGEHLRKEFEAAFCARTGRRMKVSTRSGSVPEAAAAGSSSHQDVK